MQLINFAESNLAEHNQRRIYNSDCKNSYSNEKSYSLSIEDNEAMLMKIFPGKLLFTLKEASRILNISYEFLREYTAANRVESLTLGDRRMVHIRVLSKLLTYGIN